MKISVKIVAALLVLLSLGAYRTDKPAYLLFNQKGKKISYKRMLKQASKADVVFFGELHNNPISHWLQLELTNDLYQLTEGRVIQGAEMFEADNQHALTAYLEGEMDADSLKKAARLWPNYKTDIEPLVHLARDHQIPFIATNIPRRYASMVFRNGFTALDSLPDEEKNWIAPLPIAYDADLPAYQQMLKMMDGSVHMQTPENFPKAQAIKDATMAWFIHKNRLNGTIFIHYNGAYHSDNFEGIVWYLKQLESDIKILTISTVESGQPIQIPEEKAGIANFIVAVPKEMTKTH
ncbi:MAG: ChaN family lipoprotein [Bacteroidales bacterium]|nr:ChaN family lipoprotein [Bacteroidales bacterium]